MCTVECFARRIWAWEWGGRLTLRAGRERGMWDNERNGWVKRPRTSSTQSSFHMLCIVLLFLITHTLGSARSSREWERRRAVRPILFSICLPYFLLLYLKCVTPKVCLRKSPGSHDVECRFRVSGAALVFFAPLLISNRTSRVGCVWRIASPGERKKHQLWIFHYCQSSRHIEVDCRLTEMVEKRLMNVRNRWMKRRIIQWTSKWWLDAFHIKKNAPLWSAVFTLFGRCLFLAVGEENEMQFSYCFFSSTLCFFSISLHSQAISIAKIRPPHSAYTIYFLFDWKQHTKELSHGKAKLDVADEAHEATICNNHTAHTAERTSNGGEINRMFTSSRFALHTVSFLLLQKPLHSLLPLLPLGTTRWHNGTSFPGVVSKCTQSANIQRLNEVEEVVLGAPRSCFWERRRRKKNCVLWLFCWGEKCGLLTSSAEVVVASFPWQLRREGKRGEGKTTTNGEREEVLENKRDIYVIFLMMLVFFIHSRSSFFFVFGVSVLITQLQVVHRVCYDAVDPLQSFLPADTNDKRVMLFHFSISEQWNLRGRRKSIIF